MNRIENLIEDYDRKAEEIVQYKYNNNEDPFASNDETLNNLYSELNEIKARIQNRLDNSWSLAFRTIMLFQKLSKRDLI